MARLLEPSQLNDGGRFHGRGDSALAEAIDVFYKKLSGTSPVGVTSPLSSGAQENVIDPSRESTRPAPAMGPKGPASADGVDAATIAGRAPHQYLDFDLEISLAGDEWCASVLKSPTGEATYRCRPPFSPVELEN